MESLKLLTYKVSILTAVGMRRAEQVICHSMDMENNLLVGLNERLQEAIRLIGDGSVTFEEIDAAETASPFESLGITLGEVKETAAWLEAKLAATENAD